MSTVSDYKQCLQCGFECADCELDCRTNEESLGCRMCGYSVALERVEDGDGKVTWKHTVMEGSGSLFYRPLNSCAVTIHYLSSEEKVLKAEDWLRKELDAGGVHADSAYLTRWNPETKAVECVIGTIYDFPPYDDEEIEFNQATGSFELKPDVIN